MTSANPPAKHHYIPKFLLAQWAANNGNLWRFSRSIPGKVDVKSVAPAAIGYEKYLYATPGLPPEKAQQVEQIFMSRLDSLAAEAHQFLLTGSAHKMPRKLRSAWSRFIMSQWFRTPSDLRHLKEVTDLALRIRNEPLHARYVKLKRAGYPDSIEDAIAMLGAEFREQAAMDMLRKMSDNPRLGIRLNNMQWFVFETNGGREFLISDTAVQHSSAPVFSGLGYVTIPIAPRKLFVAVNHLSVAAEIGERRNQLGVWNNHAVVRRASIFVGATDRSQELFITTNFGKEERQTLIKGLAEKYRMEVVRSQSALRPRDDAESG